MPGPSQPRRHPAPADAAGGRGVETRPDEVTRDPEPGEPAPPPPPAPTSWPQRHPAIGRASRFVLVVLIVVVLVAVLAFLVYAPGT